MSEQHRTTRRRAYSERREPRMLTCIGCGDSFRAGREARDHRPNCTPCPACAHSVAMRVEGCAWPVPKLRRKKAAA